MSSGPTLCATSGVRIECGVVCQSSVWDGVLLSGVTAAATVDVHAKGTLRTLVRLQTHVTSAHETLGFSWTLPPEPSLSSFASKTPLLLDHLPSRPPPWPGVLEIKVAHGCEHLWKPEDVTNEEYATFFRTLSKFRAVLAVRALVCC